MKFKSGTEWFRESSDNTTLVEYFKRGVSFCGGNTFPLIRGKLGKINKELLNFMYATGDKNVKED